MKRLFFTLGLLFVMIGAFSIEIDRPPDKVIQVELTQDIILPMSYDFLNPCVLDYTYNPVERKQETIESYLCMRGQVFIWYNSERYCKVAGTEVRQSLLSMRHYPTIKNANIKCGVVKTRSPV